MHGFPVKIVAAEKDRPAGDFPGFSSHIPVFSQRSMEVLGQTLTSAGEIVPLNCQNCDKDYLALNVTTLVDALHEAQSEVKRYRSSGRIRRILKYAFRVEKLKDVSIFKLPETPLQQVYVTAGFVENVIGSSLQGFVFEQVWTDAPFVVLCPYCLGLIEETTTDCPTCSLDTTRDAPLEMTLEEAQEIKHKSCPYCSTRIRAWADPCPYCKQGQQRAGMTTGVVIV